MSDKSSRNEKSRSQNAKQEQLDQFRIRNAGNPMTTKQGLKVSNDEEILKAGERGPGLIEDFYFLEKMGHFNSEEIPERMVNARGYGGLGEFETYQSMKPVTKARYITDDAKQ